MFKSFFFHPLHPPYRTYQLQRELHVVCDSFFSDIETFAISGYETNIHIWLKEKQAVVIIWPKSLHGLAFGRVIKTTVGHHSVYVYNKVFKLFFAHLCYPSIVSSMEHLQDKSSGILRSIGRIFKFDAVYLARGGSWMTLSFVVGTLCSIVTMIAFGNLLPKETYGTYSYLLSLWASLF